MSSSSARAPAEAPPRRSSTQAGLAVILVEEGPLATAADFRMLESEAYPTLYQESAARKTKDKAIGILQGRCVGGGTTVNWTSSFRTPAATLACWQRTYGLEGFAPADLAPWFERMESRLAIAPWEVAPNANNEALARGAAKLGIPVTTIRRNVKGCWNLGYCGLGCPTNAKQSMLVTTVPSRTRSRCGSGDACACARLRAPRRPRDGAHMRGDGHARRGHHGAAHHDPRPRLRRGGRRDRHAGAALAEPGAGSARPRREAHIPASDRRLRGHHARADRSVRRCAADDLFGSLPRHACRRTARSASSSKRRRRTRC